MAGVQEELWNIFTFYTLRGKPLDLARLSVTQFLRLARDCQIAGDGGATGDGGLQGRPPGHATYRCKQQGERRLGQAAVNLAFVSVIQGRNKVRPEGVYDHEKQRQCKQLASSREHAPVNSKLTYPEFLDALVVLGERMYRAGAPRRSTSATGRTAGLDSEHTGRSVESTFQQLLMENILPLASRRRPVSIVTAMSDPLLRDLLRYFAPPLREMFRFYAASPSANTRKAPSGSSGSGGRGGHGGIDGGTETIRKKLGSTKEQTPQPPTSDLEATTPLPRHSDAAVEPTLEAAADIGAASFSPAPVPREASIAVDVAGGVVGSVAATAEPMPPPAAKTASASHEGNGSPQVESDSPVVVGSGVIGERRAPSAQSSSPVRAAMNSMADALSHRSLLCFAVDFGVSGAFLSALEIGEIFLSCDGRQLENLDGKEFLGSVAGSTRGTCRTSLARAGRGGIKPLGFLGFLEALVRISLACFRRRDSEGFDAPEGEDSVGAGHCLRALLTYMWGRLHASAELALNGVRAGSARHRSSIQKGALLKGVKLFNERMLSRWRAEGFLDFAATTPITLTAKSLQASTSHAPRQGHAAHILRGLLAREDLLGVERGGEKRPDIGESSRDTCTNNLEEGGGGQRGGRRSAGQLGQQAALRSRPCPLIV